MDHFVELLRAAQGGHGMENLARVYGLSTQQAQAIADAMMPAFADGFRHITQSPEAMASLMALMLSGPYGTYYNQGAPTPSAPFPGTSYTPPPTPDLNQAGTDALNTVFGSSEVSRAVASHVAATTGLGIAMVRQIMPAYASLVVGGLAKSLAASGALQSMTAAMLSRLPIGEPATRPAPISSGNPWIDAFMAFSTTSANTRPQSSGNPWADAFAQMMFQQAQPPAAARPASSGNAWQDVVNAMANTMAQAGGQAANAMSQQFGQQLGQQMNPQPAPAMAQPAHAGGTPRMGTAPDLMNNPLQPFQEFFARMFAQGFPPAFPGLTAGERPPYSFPEFWLDLINRTPSARAPEAEILPPEKPRLVKGKDGGQ
ncbi:MULTISPECIES: DUF937 domain-containing protein [unclassified Xanthobacter]|uniref:DUF937 domain-containing protein n=1 Tax=unclassified Xanthobacter TaxID=2623496 RepID=UPI001EE0799B|nr:MULTISPECIES: DUF937 domain-containing protein [unclassified Xanthobacter]